MSDPKSLLALSALKNLTQDTKASEHADKTKQDCLACLQSSTNKKTAKLNRPDAIQKLDLLKETTSDPVLRNKIDLLVNAVQNQDIEATFSKHKIQELIEELFTSTNTSRKQTQHEGISVTLSTPNILSHPYATKIAQTSKDNKSEDKEKKEKSQEDETKEEKRSFFQKIKKLKKFFN
jgi:hypothetical protein